MRVCVRFAQTIYTEFVALPYYPVHDVLGAQHLFLNERGYRLIDIELRHPTYRRGGHAIPETADRRMLHAGDAFFMLDRRISLFLCLPLASLDRLALTKELDNIGQTS